MEKFEVKDGSFLTWLYLQAYYFDRSWMDRLFLELKREDYPEWVTFEDARCALEAATADEKQECLDRFRKAAIAWDRREEWNDVAVARARTRAMEQEWQRFTTRENLCPWGRKVIKAFLFYLCLFVPMRFVLRLAGQVLGFCWHHLIARPAGFAGSVLGRNARWIGVTTLALIVFVVSFGASTIIVDHRRDIAVWVIEAPSRMSQAWSAYWVERAEQQRQAEILAQADEEALRRHKAKFASYEAASQALEQRRQAEELRRAAEIRAWEEAHPVEVRRRQLEEQAAAARRAEWKHEENMRTLWELLQFGLLFVVAIGGAVLFVFLLTVLFNIDALLTCCFLAFLFVNFDGRKAWWQKGLWARVGAVWSGFIQVWQFIAARLKAWHDGICPPIDPKISEETQARILALIEQARA